MKTIEEKAKAYDEAIERAKLFQSQHPTGSEGDLIVAIFPELKISDDKIREALIELVKCNERSGYTLLNDVPTSSMLEWLEKQGGNHIVDNNEMVKPIKWNKNTKDCKPKANHSVLMKTTHGIAEGEWQGERWHLYRWTCKMKDSEVLAWMVLSNLEGQSEQKPTWGEEDEAHVDSLLKRLEGMCKPGALLISTRFAISEDEDWLKTIKDRVQP